MSVQRFPEGTAEIPFPHKVFHWSDLKTTLVVEVDPHDYRRGSTPAIAGWEPFFVGFHGYDKPTHLSYRPVAT